jgi:hypothetical protein
MDPIDVDRYEENFTTAVKQQQMVLDTCRAMGDRDQDKLAEIETDLERLAATASGRDLDFWRGEQASQLFADLDEIHERIVCESRR